MYTQFYKKRGLIQKLELGSKASRIRNCRSYDYAVMMSDMEEDVGRGRNGRESKAHASARSLKVAAPAAKRGRGRHGLPMVQGTHDAEAGGSRSRARSRLGQAQGRVPAVQDDFDADQYINDDADYAEDENEAHQQPPHQPPQQAPPEVVVQPPQNVEEQGYGGGPRDLSLLSDYHNHRAIPIWDANANNHEVLKRNLRCVASGKNVIDIQKTPRDERWFWGPIEAAGLEPLTKTNYSVLDYGLLWAFAERWHPKTSTFHLPLGELGITLDDVQCLLHIPIEGKFLNHRKMTREEGDDMVSSFLGVAPAVVLDLFVELNGPHLKHSFVESIFIDNWGYADKAVVENKPMHEVRLYRERSIRDFLLYLACCTIFSNKSSYYVDVVYLQFFQDLSTVHQWNWGAAALVHLQNYMDHASAAKTN